MKAYRHIWTSLLGAACLTLGCVSSDSGILDATKDCPELRGEVAKAPLDVRVGGFVEAAVAFRDASGSLKADVLKACAAVATDLGATDTWSSIGDADRAVSNDQSTGACDAAGRLVEDALLEGRRANANIALAVSKRNCRFDFAAQRACEVACFADATCDGGTVQTRCEPGRLSVECSGECTAGSTCEGTTDLPANCMGKCESLCQGQCAGACIDENGHRTDNDPNCRGKCSSACNGTCRGQCKIEQTAGVACGASVRCVGSCSGSVSAPECESEFTAPTCMVNAGCFAACRAKVAANAICEPPVIVLLVDVIVAPALKPLVSSLEEHLPPLLEAADARGQVMMNAAHALSITGASVKDSLKDLDGHSLACLGEASTTLAEAAGHFDVSIRSSLSIDTTVRTNAN